MPGRDLIERVRKALGDRYTVLTAVGRGGNASIFAGRDPTGAQVAIKVLHPELAVAVAADRFLREIRYASQLNHPHIARMIDSGEADYLLWYVMPYLPGETLRQALRRESRLSIASAVAIAAEVLDALEHAHAHGIAHRDIKPDRSEEHTSELQSHSDLVCRLLLEKKKNEVQTNTAQHITQEK